MQHRAVCVVAAACAFAAPTRGSACSNEYCPYTIDESFFWDVFWLAHRARLDDAAYSSLAPRFCNTTSWMALYGCAVRCPVAFELTAPPEAAGVRLCLRDNYFSGVGGEQLTTDHPLIGRELQLAAAASGCSADDLSGVSGKVALIQRGGCADTSIAANAGRGGALAAIVVNDRAESIPEDAWFQLDNLSGTVPSGGLGVTMMVSRALGGPVLAMAAGGATVRGRFVMECDREPSQLTDAEVTAVWDGCPRPDGIHECGDVPPDMLCSGCMLEGVIDGNESDTFCLYSSAMMPLRAENSLLSTATLQGRDFSVRVLELPGCLDGAGEDPYSELSCADVRVLLSQREIGTCADLRRYGLSPEDVQWFFTTCRATCSPDCKQVPCPTASDFANASGEVVFVSAVGDGCSAPTVSLASEAGVAAVVFARKFVGLSLGVDVPVHYLARSGMERVLQRTPARVRIRRGPGPDTPQLAGPPRDPVMEPRDSFTFSWPVVLCAVLAAVLLMLDVAIFVRQRATVIRFWSAGETTVRVPLSTVSVGFGVSILTCITVVTFALAHQTGRETTDTALFEGWESVERAHAHARDQIHSLHAKILSQLLHRVHLGLQGAIAAGLEAGGKLSRLAERFTELEDRDVFLQGIADTVSGVSGSYPGQVTHSMTGWVYAFRSVDGHFGGRRMKTVTVNGTKWVESYVQLTDEKQLISSTVFDPMNYFARQYGSAIEFTKNLEEGVHTWVACDRPQATSFNVFWQMYSQRPVSVLFPMYTGLGEYVGVLEAVSRLDEMTQHVPVHHTSNVTVVVLGRGSPNIVGTSMLRGQRVTEEYTRPWGKDDRLTSPLTLATMPVFELNALDEYLRDQYGSLAGGVGRLHEFDQMDWYARSGQQPFQVMKVSFDGGEAVDESPSKWRLRLGGSSSIVGGCRSGRCLDVDGTSSLEVFRNLSTDIPRVRDGRNVTSPAFNPSWNHTRWIGDTEVVHVPDQNPGQAGTPPVQWFPLLREPVLSRQHTVTMWVRPRRSYSEADLDGSFGATLWTDTLSAESAVRITAGGRMIVRGGHGEVCCRTKPLPGGLPAGVWTHIAASLDTWNTRFSMRRQDRPPHELLYAQMCRVFINGSLFSEYPVASSSQEYDLISDNPSPYRVGHGFDGQIDDLQLYNVSLSGSEVRHAMQTGEFRRTAPSREFYSHGSRFAETELDWITLLLLPRDDVMREVERIRRLQTSSSNARREDTDAKLAQRTVETVLATVVIAMGSIAALLLFNEALTKPIGTFARQLLDVAVMKVDGATEERSVIEELDAMYVAMSLVVTNLKEYRQYLPQTLLMEEDDEEESDEEGAEPVHALSLSTTASRSLAGSDHRSSDRRSSDRRSSASHSDVDVFRGSTRSGGRQSFLHQHLHQKSITLCVVNVVGYLGHVRERRTLAVATFHDEYLQEITTRVGSSKGIVDLFVGDRVSVSFNAMRQCGQHRPAAVSAMVYLTAGSGVAKSIKLSGGAATGSALCGSLGTTSLKRFSIIGAVATMAALLERVAVQHSVRLLVDDTLRLDTEEHFTYRLTECVVFPKVSRRLCLMYEARTPAPFTGTGPSDDVDRDEWMYCMDERQARAKALNPWFRYNEAQRTFWGGADARTVLEKLEASTTGRDADVEELEYRDDKEQELKDRLKWAGQDSRAFQPKIVAEVGCPLVDVADSSCRVVDPPIGAWANEVAVVRAPSTPLLH